MLLLAKTSTLLTYLTTVRALSHVISLTAAVGNGGSEVNLSNSLRLLKFMSRLMIKRRLMPQLEVRPVVSELFVTENCNLRCVSCACWRDKTQGEMSREEWFDVIRQLGELSFIKINFTGGEPLLRRDLVDLIRFASINTRAELHLNTNALLLTPSKTQELIDAGLRSFNISIDGATSEMHDGIRGRQGAFATTLEHLRHLMSLQERYGLKIRMCFTVMRDNHGQLPEMAELAQELKVRLFLNVLTDHTFLFRNYGIKQLGELSEDDLDRSLNAVLAKKSKNRGLLPPYSVFCYIGDHFRSQLQKDLPCAESSLKFMVHSKGQAGGCWGHDPDFSIRTRRVSEILDDEKYKRIQTDHYFKRCRGCGANHSFNMRLEPRPMIYNLLWRLGIWKQRRQIYA